MSQASKNIFWLTLSRVAALVFLFIAYTRLFRYLGPYNSGQYQFALSYVTLFGVIIDFGIQQYIIKKITEEPESRKKYFQNFLAVEILLVTLIYAAMIVVGYSNHYDHKVFLAIMVAGLGTAINGLSYPFLAVMSAFQDLKKVALINFLNSAINIAIIVLTIVLHKDIVFLASNQVIFSIVALLLYIRFVRVHIPHPQIFKTPQSLDLGLVKKIFKAALPFAMLVGFSTLYNRIDVVLIAKMRGFHDTGLYTAAYKYFDLLAFFPAVVSHVLYPVFSGLMAKGAVTEVRGHIEQYLRFLAALAFPLAIGSAIFSKQIILLVAGPQYIDAAPVLAVLSFAPAILYLYIVANSLVISQLTKFAVAITGLNVLVNMIGNIILLPRVGIVGAAYMTVGSELLQGIFYFYFIHKKITPFKLFSQLWQPCLSAVCMGVVLSYAHAVSLVTGGALGASSYLVFLYIFGFFREGDLDFLHSMFTKKPGVAV